MVPIQLSSPSLPSLSSRLGPRLSIASRNIRAKRSLSTCQATANDASDSNSASTSDSDKPKGPFSGVKQAFISYAASTNALQAKLKDLGIAGVVAYGLFNTLYYVGMFLFIWIFVAQMPRGLGIGEAAKKFLEVFALTWAGSQVTKLIRAGAAVALAPAVDRGLDVLIARLGLGGKGQALGVAVAFCVSLAVVLFGAVVLIWS